MERVHQHEAGNPEFRLLHWLALEDMRAFAHPAGEDPDPLLEPLVYRDWDPDTLFERELQRRMARRA